MTIYSDNAGNKFLGDCIWANHNISYPNTNFLQAQRLTNFSTDLTSLLTQSGLLFRNVIPQTNINNWLSGSSALLASLVHFGFAGDIDDRFAFTVAFNSGNNAETGPVTLYNNSGSTNTINSASGTVNKLASTEFPTNSAYGVSGGWFGIAWQRENINISCSPIYVCGVANSNSLALYFSQKSFVGGGATYLGAFFYAGRFADINSNFNYYNASEFTQSFIMSGGGGISINGSSILNLNARHYIANTSKYPRETGDAQYPIACSDGQSPTAQWATDFYVFDNNATLGYPAIGRVRNLLLAQGNYTIGKPVRIQGTAMPDNGFNAWLPVGTFAGKTVLMRCYSSVTL